MEKEIEIPEDLEVEVEDHLVRVKGNGDEVEKKMDHPGIQIEVKENKAIVSSESDRKEDNQMVGTYTSHLRNMIEGIKEPFVYKMKSVYSHFPTNVKVQGDELLIENFFGERNPRRAKIYDNVNVEVDGEEITISGADKEAVAQTAARIEQICPRGTRDPRKFQDGVYITRKGDKNV